MKTVNVLPIRPIWFCKGLPFVPFTSFLGLWTEAFASFGSSRCLSESLGIFWTTSRRVWSACSMFQFPKERNYEPFDQGRTLFLRSIKLSQKTSHEVSDIQNFDSWNHVATSMFGPRMVDVEMMDGTVEVHIKPQMFSQLGI